DRQHRAASMLDGRCAVVVQRVRDRSEIAAGEQRLETMEELWIDRERVRERAVLRAGLLDHDLAVALDDLRLDLADLLVDERFHRLLAREDAATRFFDAGRAERVGRPGESQRRLRALPAFQQRRRCPCGLEGLAVEAAVDGLKDGPYSLRRLR